MKHSNKLFYLFTGSLSAALIILGISMKVFGLPEDGNSMYVATIPQQKIIGNGKIITKTYSVANFNNINVKGSYHITLKPGTADKVILSTDENILPKTYITVTHNTLNIGLTPGTSAKFTRSDLIIPVSNLKNLNLGGANILKAQGINSDSVGLRVAGKNSVTLQGDIKKLLLKMAGNSELKINVPNADTVNIKASGNSDIGLTGSSNNLTITSAGKTTVTANQLQTNDVVIRGAGYSDITVNANKTLSVMTAGKTNVRYSGNPKVSKTAVGDVNIIKIQ